MRTWLGKELDRADGGREEAVRHVMEVYAGPLAIYCRGSSLRWIGDPDDLVRGFFADRLSREAFLDRWRESGRPLRYWLIVGFKHFLYEEARRKKRDDGASVLQPDSFDESDETQPESAFERACARAIVRGALERCAASCEKDGLEEHFDVFRRHYIGGESYESIAAETSNEPRRLSVMSRTVATRFKRALRDLAGWDGASAEQVDGEVRQLMEALRA